MSSDFQHFLSPTKIGPIEIRNRAAISAHLTSLQERRSLDHRDGGHSYGKRYATYLEQRAKGGAGLIIIGQYASHPTTINESPADCPGWDEAALPGMKMAVEAVKKHGAAAFVQFAHSGGMNAGGWDGETVWAPSEIACINAVVGKANAKEMDKKDMADLIKHYVLCARNAKQAGADGVEIHAAHSYLLNEFLSPLFNKRTDEYGGSLENRARLVLEVMQAIREEIGKDMALGIRLSCDEYMPGAMTLEDYQQVAKLLDAQGAINYINVSQGLITHTLGPTVPMHTFPHAAFKVNAAGIREAVSDKIKVIATGRIIDPSEAEQILADGHADLCIMTRAHIADPEIVNKTREGRLDELRACVGCGNGCTNPVFGIGTQCTQNPCVGFEDRGWAELVPAAKKKKVMVVGGGPGGMEAAWVAAARGHDVTLYEKGPELGGQVLLAREVQSELDAVIRWRKLMVAKHGVKVLLNTEVTPEMVEKEKPDAVILATGAIPRRDGFSHIGNAPIPGWDGPNVTIPEDILSGRVQTGQNVLVYDLEGFTRGYGTAEKLAREGKTVTLVFPTPYPDQSDNAFVFLALTQRLAAQGISLIPQTIVLSLNGDSAMIRNSITEKIETLTGFDTIVLVGTANSNRLLYKALDDKVPELYDIGDCHRVRRLDVATFEGYRCARTL